MSHRKIALAVGLFIISTSILLILSLVYVINKKGVFEHHISYKLIAKNAEEIEEGMPILFSGFEIGQVDKLSLHRNGEVLIIISVPEHNSKWIRSDSIFTLEKPLIGKPKIILTSSMTSPPLQQDIILNMHIKDGINEIITDIQPLILQLHSIVSNVNALSASLSDQNASFQNSLHNVEKFSNNMASSPNLLQSFTGDKQSAQILQNAVSSLDSAIKDFDYLVKNTNEGISEIRSDVIKPTNTNMKELELILKDVHNKLKDIDSTVKTIGQSDKDIVFLKDEMKVWLKEVTELSERINSIIGKEQEENIDLP